MPLSKYFRRQYLLTNQKVERLKDWTCLFLDKAKFNAYINPDLSFTHFKNEEVEILLLGYILSYQSPEKTDQEIVTDLSKFTNFPDFVRATYSLGGRFLMVYNNGKQTYLLPDTLRMRMAYYHFSKDSDTFYIAPQCKLITNFIDLEKEDDPDFLELLKSEQFKRMDNCIPGEGTFYKEIKNLNSNHYLDFQHRKAVRFFPTIADEKPTMKIKDFDAGIEQCNQMLQGFLKAIHLRHTTQIMMPFTAGWDSRLMIAASKNINEHIQYFINQFPHMTNRHSDIRVPKKLSQQLGLHFTINHLAQTKVGEEFKDIYQNSYDVVVDRYLAGHYTQAQYYKGKLIMHTVGSEVAKCMNICGIDHLPINRVLLNRVIEFGNKIKYVNTQTQRWIEKMQALPKMENIHLVELYAWENIESNTTIPIIGIADMYCETCSIFNCRDYITTMWTVPIRYRSSKQRFATQMLKKMWKEVLALPINPPNDLKGIGKRVAQKLGILDYLRRRKMAKEFKG